ncbi:phosphotransferase [Desulfonatronum thioautotrophicum]|uniref:phosphotransferase n=1 Tax=Desulfonatronum thioautotrophicum TaxID=617001 RepID=UPI0005EAF1DA|nr:phosphotransferase [Desulfonatronum thioautotrophicum]
MNKKSVWKAIENELVAQRQAIFGSEARIQIRGVEYVSSPYTLVYKLKIVVDDTTKFFFAKCISSDFLNQTALYRLETEYAVLTKLRQSFEAFPDLGVVRPVAILPKVCTLLTEAEEGDPLENLINPACRFYRVKLSPRALAGCFRAGRWLQEFQKTTFVGNGAFDCDEYLKYCGARLEWLRKRSVPGIENHSYPQLKRILNKAVTGNTAPGHRITGRHNDFAPHNIIERENHISVLDFTMFDNSSRYYDMCNFWCKLDKMKDNWYISNGFVDRLQDSFLEGYGDSDGVTHPLFLMVRIRLALVDLVQAYSDMEKDGKPTSPAKGNKCHHAQNNLHALLAKASA